MQILVAPDKFKGSLTAAEVAERVAAGLEQQPGLRCTRLPLADGGDGSVAASIAAGFRPHTVTVAGPTGRPHRATIAYDGATAVVEVANTCGIALLPAGHPQPLAATSLGFGQAVRAALALGPATVVLALGGSASTDGGTGLLTPSVLGSPARTVSRSSRSVGSCTGSPTSTSNRSTTSGA